MPRPAIERDSRLPDLATSATATMDRRELLALRLQYAHQRRAAGQAGPVAQLARPQAPAHGYVVLQRRRVSWSSDLWEVQWITPRGVLEMRRVGAAHLASTYRRLLATTQALAAQDTSPRATALRQQAEDLSALLDLVAQGERLERAARRAAEREG